MIATALTLAIGFTFGIIMSYLWIKHYLNKVSAEIAGTKNSELSSSEYDPLTLIKKAKEEIAQKETEIIKMSGRQIELEKKVVKLKETEKKFNEILKLKEEKAEMSEIFWTLNRFEREMKEEEVERRIQEAKTRWVAATGAYIPSGAGSGRFVDYNFGLMQEEMEEIVVQELKPLMSNTGPR
jgi:hypothetical protein